LILNSEQFNKQSSKVKSFLAVNNPIELINQYAIMICQLIKDFYFN